MAEPQVKSRSFADRITPAHWPKAEPEVEEARESFMEARSRSRESVMLDIRLADGTVESFNYAYLTRVRYVPGDTLSLRFGVDEVRAEGRNLSRLRDAISEHRMRFIQEGSEEDEVVKPEDAPHIGRIVIIDRGEL